MPSDPGTVALRRKMLTILLTLFVYFQNILKILTAVYDQEAEEISTACRLLAAELQSIMIERVPVVRIQNYVNITIPLQSSTQFQQHFRMTPEVFEMVLRHVAPKIKSLNKFSSITKMMDPRKQLLAVLWLLATPDSYRSVGDRFDLAKSSLHRSFKNIVKVLNSMSKYIIKWPVNKEAQTAQQFYRCGSIPGVIGAIDGSYIAIKAPEEYHERYINRKSHYAITVQAVCKSNLVFTDIFAGYPSSVSDIRIFRNSDLYKKIINNELDIPPNYFVVGDKAYPILKWLITPYKEHQSLDESQRNFNRALAKTRQCIERAFALLKGRFRRLKYLDMARTDLVPAVILGCCVLHNLCLFKENNEETILKYILEGTTDEDSNNEHEAELNNLSENDHSIDQREGQNLRERIRHLLL